MHDVATAVEDYNRVLSCQSRTRTREDKQDGMVQIHPQKHESIKPACIVSAVQAVGLTVWGKFYTYES